MANNKPPVLSMPGWRPLNFALMGTVTWPSHVGLRLAKAFGDTGAPESQTRVTSRTTPKMQLITE